MAVFAVVLQHAITDRFPGSTTRAWADPTIRPPLAMANRLAEAFATSFWWSFAVCAFAVLPAVFLPGPLKATPGVWEELEEAEAINLDEVAEIIPE